jgi:hypothetical protein
LFNLSLVFLEIQKTVFFAASILHEFSTFPCVTIGIITGKYANANKGGATDFHWSACCQFHVRYAPAWKEETGLHKRKPLT